MKIKHQLAIFNALTRLLVILILWLMLPILVENVVYHHINNSLLEKKKKFIEHLNQKEINDFLDNPGDSTETFSEFSTLHSEFLVLSRSPIKERHKNIVLVTITEKLKVKKMNIGFYGIIFLMKAKVISSKLEVV